MVRPDQDRIFPAIGDHVEVDETLVGGRTRGEGRGVHHKVLVATAVEVRHHKDTTNSVAKRNGGRYAGRLRLALVPDRSAESLCDFVEGAVASLPIWADLVSSIPQYISGDWFMTPPGVVKRKICSQSGQLAIESKCPEPMEEVFLTDNIPAEYCKIPEHQMYSGGTWKKWWKKVWRK